MAWLDPQIYPGRLISLALRSDISIQAIHRQLRGIASDRAIGLGPNKVLSVPDAIGIALEAWMRQKQGVQQNFSAASGLFIWKPWNFLDGATR